MAVNAVRLVTETLTSYASVRLMIGHTLRHTFMKLEISIECLSRYTHNCMKTTDDVPHMCSPSYEILFKLISAFQKCP